MSDICLKCGNTHSTTTDCTATRKSVGIPNDTRNARCTICGDWFHRDGILNHVRSCATKKIRTLESDNARLRKAIEEAPHDEECADSDENDNICKWKRDALEGK